MTAVEKLQKIIDEHSRIVFFGGAGVSTESGIPDFRSVDGLYNQKYGRVLPVLQRKNADYGCRAECSTFEVGRT